jgi:two-component system sensor histidine kinase ArlS
MELIFQSFYRGSNTREYAGQGIGLSLSMKIFSVYRGKVSIRSEEGKGTEVRVVFA